MLKLAALLALVFVVCRGDEVMISPPGALSAKEKLEKVIMPDLSDKGLLQSVDKSKCLDKNIYDNTNKLLAVHSEQGYLCAYIAFQANKKEGVGVGLYKSTNEATDRYKCFKKTVDQVNKINSQHLSYTAGINKFADMTPYEKSMSLGFGIRTKEELEAEPKHCGGSSDDDKKLSSSADDDDKDDDDNAEAEDAGAMNLGSSMSLGSAPVHGVGSAYAPPRGLGSAPGDDAPPGDGDGDGDDAPPGRGLGRGAPLGLGLRRRRDV